MQLAPSTAPDAGGGIYSREVGDGKGGILVEVLRLDEALEQVPAHGGWRAGRRRGRWARWCGLMGMGVQYGVAPRRRVAVAVAADDDVATDDERAIQRAGEGRGRQSNGILPTNIQEMID